MTIPPKEKDLKTKKKKKQKLSFAETCSFHVFFIKNHLQFTHHCAPPSCATFVPNNSKITLHYLAIQKRTNEQTNKTNIKRYISRHELLEGKCCLGNFVFLI